MMSDELKPERSMAVPVMDVGEVRMAVPKYFVAVRV